MAYRKPDLSDLLAAEDQNSSIINLDNFIGDICAYGEHLERLTPAQQSFYFNQCLEREVMNGGFWQYFINSSGAYAHETLASLAEIGANRTMHLLRQAIEQFPQQVVPKADDERQSVVEEIAERASPTWESLDQQFFDYPDDLNALNMAFVINNRDQF